MKVLPAFLSIFALQAQAKNGQFWRALKNMPDTQKAAFETCFHQNCFNLLPTGGCQECSETCGDGSDGDSFIIQRMVCMKECSLTKSCQEGIDRQAMTKCRMDCFKDLDL